MEIKPVLIMESCLNGLTLNEGASEIKRDKFILSGIFTEFDIKNRNERIYTKERFLPHLNEMLDRIKTLTAVYGEFDHPDVFDTSLTRVSHLIHSASFNESKNRVDGSIRLLNTPNGKTAKELVLDGCPLFVSSRAAGVTESDGTVTVKKLFTYDAVADPGFASARMNLNVINESLGFNESVNLRIVDMSNESKINELFDMNKNDQVTQTQVSDFKAYLENEIPKIQEQILQNIKEGKNPEKLDQLSEYYENLQESYTKMTKYLDYLADNVQILVNENLELKTKADNLIKHSDYLAENLEKSINYSNYLAEKLDKTIDYSEYISENLSKSIDFSEYIAENVDKTIKYSEYLAENVDKTIDYSEYIAEHTEFNLKNYEMLSEYIDNTVKYSEYVAEQVDNNIAYSEYLSEHIDNNINYTEYVAEHVDNNIAYSEYIAENLSDTQAYSKYIAESLDRTIDVVKGEKLNEDVQDDQRISDLKVNNVDKYYNDEEGDEFPPVDEELPEELLDVEEEEEEAPPVQPETAIEPEAQPALEPEVQPELPIDEVPAVQGEEVTLLPGTMVTVDVDGDQKEGEIISFNPQDGFAIVKLAEPVQVQPEAQAQPEDAQVQPQAQIDGQPAGDAQVQVQGQPTSQGQPVQTQTQPVQEIEVHESKITVKGDRVLESEESIKDTITKLITETKKRKASEEQQPHFLMFLGEKNKETWNKLSLEDKEKTIVAVNESTYSSEKDVLNIIREALSASSKSEEEILIDAIPTDLKDVWNNLNDTVKKSVLASAKFYPNLVGSELKMESFWSSRDLHKYAEPKRQLLNENKNYVDDIKLSENQVDKYLSIFKNL
jgi:hypothetical protein